MTRTELDAIRQRSNVLSDAPIVDNIVRDIAELPDRTSPDVQPDMMLVTEVELGLIIGRHIEGIVTEARTDRSALLAYLGRLETENAELKARIERMETGKNAFTRTLPAPPPGAYP